MESNDGNLSSHSSGGQESEIKELAGPCSLCNVLRNPASLLPGFGWFVGRLWYSLAGSQLDHSRLRLHCHMALSLCVCLRKAFF